MFSLLIGTVATGGTLGGLLGSALATLGIVDKTGVAMCTIGGAIVGGVAELVDEVTEEYV